MPPKSKQPKGESPLTTNSENTILDRKRKNPPKDEQVQRHARDIQTPAPEPAESTSKEQFDSIAEEENLNPPGGSNNPSQESEEQPNTMVEQENSNPPGGSNISSQGSEERSDLMDEQEDWARQIFEEETANIEDVGHELTKLVMVVEPDWGSFEAFFDQVNERIRSKNKEIKADQENGVINSRIFVGYMKRLRDDLSGADSVETAELCIDSVRSDISKFNQNNVLGEEWNVDRQVILDAFAAALNPQPESTGEQPTGGKVEWSPLDELESRTRKDQHLFSTCEVLYWWPKGTGTQTFVKYGHKSAPIYRIRAGSYESFDKKRVARVFTSGSRTSRGMDKRIINVSDGEDEVWAYNREDVYSVLGVGWKVPDDDDSDTLPLSLIVPQRGASYPQTKCLIQWKDGHVTLEGRTFMRRITNGSAFRGDENIYQKARELEDAYEEINGPFSKNFTSSDDEVDQIINTESDEDSDDSHLSPRKPKHRGHRSGRKREKSGSSKDELIKALQRQIAELSKDDNGSPPRRSKKDNRQRRRGRN